MAVLETIRVKFGVLITVLIAIALLSFIVDPSVFNSCASGNGDVAEIEGKDLTYIDYQAEVEKSRMVFDMDQNTRGRLGNAELQGYVWSKCLNEYGFFKKFDEAGILATDYNVAVVLQNNPAYSYFLSLREQRPEYGVLVDDMVYRMKSMLYNTQYTKLFQNSSFCNPLAIANEMNEKSDKTSFIEIPVAGADTIAVSEEEVKAWYDSHIETFKLAADRKNNRHIDFAVFELNPSESDVEKARTSANEQLAELEGKDAEEFTETRYYMENELSSESVKLNEFVFGDSKKNSEMVQEGNDFYAIRVIDSKMLPDSVEFICVPAQGENTADSLFNENAQNYKMTYNMIDDNFMDAASFVSAAKGKAFVAPTKGQQDMLVKVISKTKNSLHKRVSFVKETAFVSEETDNLVADKANEFSAAAADFDSFSNELAALGQKDALHTAEISSEMYDLPYEGKNLTNARELIKWAFEAKKGHAVSGVIKLDKAYVVAGLHEINETGYVPFEDVRAGVENQVKLEKRLAEMSEEVKAKINGLEDMDAIAKALNAEVETEDIIFSYSNLDPKFVGAVSASETEKVYGPLVGMNSIFIYKVVSREDRNPMLEEEITNRKFNPYAERYMSGNIMDAMYRTLDVDDDRVKFM